MWFFLHPPSFCSLLVADFVTPGRAGPTVGLCLFFRSSGNLSIVGFPFFPYGSVIALKGLFTISDLLFLLRTFYFFFAPFLAADFLLAVLIFLPSLSPRKDLVFFLSTVHPQMVPIFLVRRHLSVLLLFVRSVTITSSSARLFLGFFHYPFRVAPPLFSVHPPGSPWKSVHFLWDIPPLLLFRSSFLVNP